MASFKELSLSRPLPHPNSRHHSHSFSLGAANSTHRVTRRKSVTTAAAANAAAVVAATMKDIPTVESRGIPMPSHRRGSRRGLESSSLGVPSAAASSYLSRSGHSPSDHHPVARKSADGGLAANSPPGDDATGALADAKQRDRRASEGSHLVKGEGKRSMVELRCERCGKGYKHGSCLSKHMWEHDPAWAITSKLLISKHQQVQLLEAASVLVNMNQECPTADGCEIDSDLSSASPDASSELRDGLSSAETTPPPMDEDDDDRMEMSVEPEPLGKQFSVSNASGPFSRSFHSIPASSFTGSAPWPSPGFSHHRHSSIDTRPSTAEAKLHDDDEADLAAAIGLCNFGTPRTRPVAMSPSVPTVPELPTRVLDHPAGTESRSLDPSTVGFTPATPNIFPSLSYNPSLSYKVSDEREVRRGATDRSSRKQRNADVDFGSRPAPADDDDDGVFGRMEE
ncbi:hypothetical protein P168DRAFT_288478 [Aspergillus campestris IBT 28561]|uniref:C2H2-type domain-containing protein n=1 Tax=Aspergillus campestris (strain IBT 28561) TaxID=1392248 RepID=A0A2I1D9K3_ASPC2|nr:uncharacterized protein P168DRAFT_288478 [Aspergillus campestris IBT 28561]PKY06542.1 hypothetical protein P168DRAFT_288478 [Aspergillus campestris IBT 28561]